MSILPISSDFRTGLLPNGLRFIHHPIDSQVVYCGIAVRTGTRNEEPTQQGLAHFCEHLTFKGTARRSAVQIINAIEGVGGELNAFTNKEDTVFYCAIQKDHFRKAYDVLTDMVFNSQYPQTEVEKEREVVCDEIESYEDSPAELIYDEIENILFEGHPLGHNILGSSEQIRSYHSDDARRFTQKWYHPENCVLFVSGATPFFPTGTTVSTNQPAVDNGSHSEAKLGGFFVRQRGTHQAHVMMGTRAYASSDPRRWALYLLNNIIGGPAMNSKLSLSLRERHGLVYTVESSMTCYSDMGLWTVYFGCDQHDVRRCCRLVNHELERLMEKPLSASQLAAAKRQLQGQLAVACDNREQFSLDFARTFLFTGKIRTLTDVVKHIDSLTPQDLQLTAQDLFAPERITTLVYE